MRSVLFCINLVHFGGNYWEPEKSKKGQKWFGRGQKWPSVECWDLEFIQFWKIAIFCVENWNLLQTENSVLMGQFSVFYIGLHRRKLQWVPRAWLDSISCLLFEKAIQLWCWNCQIKCNSFWKRDSWNNHLVKCQHQSSISSLLWAGPEQMSTFYGLNKCVQNVVKLSAVAKISSCFWKLHQNMRE